MREVKFGLFFIGLVILLCNLWTGKGIGTASVIHQVGLDLDRNSMLVNTPMGMQQMLGLAQALMEGTELLILDELLNGLNKSGADEMRQLLLLKEQEKTILFVSHDPNDARILCCTIHEMDAGMMKVVN